MPSNWWGLRKKYIHSVGAVGKVKFQTRGNHPYTGIFKGADHGIVRFSSAVNPEGGYLAPGMGLKFLRDGIDSANLVAMYSTAGTPGDWNFFSKDFTTHVPAPEGAVLKAMAAKFGSYSDYIQQVGLSEMSYSKQDGQPDAPPVFPYSLIFKPHEDVHSLFPSNGMHGTDFMEHLTESGQVKKDMILYRVYAVYEPTFGPGSETYIG